MTGQPAAPVAAPPLADQVYEYLRAAILNGELPQGETISPARIAQELNVSATPVRHALLLLEADGLIDAEPRRWTRVASPPLELAREIYPLVAVLEAFAVKSIRAIDAELIERLRNANEEFRAAADVADAAGCIRANDEFHDALVQASGNPTLLNVLRPIKARGQLLDSQFFRIDAPQSWREHNEIIEALAARDRDRAAEIVQQQWLHFLPNWAPEPSAEPTSPTEV
jgi:DNA-binding GntR family transcriptional regulator